MTEVTRSCHVVTPTSGSERDIDLEFEIIFSNNYDVITRMKELIQMLVLYSNMVYMNIRGNNWRSPI